MPNPNPPIDQIKPYMFKEGDGRAGRPKGKKNKRTIKQEIAEEQLRQAIFQNLKPLTLAALQSAKGESYIYRIDRDEEGHEKHVLVDNPHEIAEALDAISAGDFDESYYYVNTKPSNTHALKELFDRGFGKAKENKEVKHDIGETTLAFLLNRAIAVKAERKDTTPTYQILNPSTERIEGQKNHE